MRQSPKGGCSTRYSGGWRCDHSGRICSCVAAGPACSLMALDCQMPVLWACHAMRVSWAASTRTLKLQVTRGTVDEGIHALATRKLRLDAAVLEGITATGDARKGKGGVSAADTVQVRWRLLLLHCIAPRTTLACMHNWRTASCTSLRIAMQWRVQGSTRLYRAHDSSQNTCKVVLVQSFDVCDPAIVVGFQGSHEFVGNRCGQALMASLLYR